MKKKNKMDAHYRLFFFSTRRELMDLQAYNEHTLF